MLKKKKFQTFDETYLIFSRVSVNCWPSSCCVISALGSSTSVFVGRKSFIFEVIGALCTKLTKMIKRPDTMIKLIVVCEWYEQNIIFFVDIIILLFAATGNRKKLYQNFFIRLFSLRDRKWMFFFRIDDFFLIVELKYAIIVIVSFFFFVYRAIICLENVNKWNKAILMTTNFHHLQIFFALSVQE